MALEKLVSLGKLASLPKGRAKLVVLPDGTRLACVRRADAEVVDVVDDRCPHEGHPLSMGLVREGVLTCQWHNWKFELGSGGCLAGGEAVRRYPTEIWNDEVFVDLHKKHDPARFAEDLSRTLREGTIDAAVRVGLRWAAFEPDAPLERMVLDLAHGRSRGLLDAVPAIAAIRALSGLFSPAESLALMAQVTAHELHGRASRQMPPVVFSQLDDAQSFLAELVEERRADAVGRVLGLPAEVSAETIVARWLLPWTAAKLWDRGEALARVAGVVELLPSLSSSTARQLVAALTESLSWSVAESDLPPWRATRNGLLAASAITPGDRVSSLELEGGEPESVARVLSELQAGTSTDSLFAAIERASLSRLRRYDPRWSQKIGSTASAPDAGAPLVMSHAVRRLARLASPSQTLAWCVQAAGLVGKLTARDGEEHTASGDLGGRLRDDLLDRAPDESLARRLVVARAVYEHADYAALDRALGPVPSLTRLAGNAVRHVQTGTPPTDGS